MKIVGMDVPPPDPRVLSWEKHTGMLLHEAALLFPDLAAEAYCNLKNNIEAHGLLEPIWVTRKGWLLDGRHRKRICNELGLDCPERVYEGKDPFGFVASLNLHRRHLTTRERAEIAAKFATRKPGYRNHATKKAASSFEGADRLRPLTIKQAATLMKVGHASVERAKAAQKRRGVTRIASELPQHASQRSAEPWWKAPLTTLLRKALTDATVTDLLRHVHEVLDVES